MMKRLLDHVANEFENDWDSFVHPSRHWRRWIVYVVFVAANDLAAHPLMAAVR